MPPGDVSLDARSSAFGPRLRGPEGMRKTSTRACRIDVEGVAALPGHEGRFTIAAALLRGFSLERR